jgi:zinc/manganese transport system substrate-binding protein
MPETRHARGAVARSALAAAIGVSLLAAGCGQGAAGSDSGRLRVVAAENFWGSIARQLGGGRVEVTSLITNPASDPHDYEPTSSDARTMAEAQVAIVNGIGYDTWATRLLDANPTPGREVVDVGDLLGLRTGDNPHQWYSPPAVQRVVAGITAAYRRADPRHAAYFDRRRHAFETRALSRYRGLIAAIRKRYRGVPVGASESIFAPLAPALGLRLITPTGFLDAISEGTEPTAAEKASTDAQITDGRIRVWVYNSQNATPDVQRLNDEARSAGIPVATVTETLTPAGTTFEAWQERQLEGLRRALREATGR